MHHSEQVHCGYLGITTRDIIAHLLDRYGKITPADIADNQKRFEDPIDNTQPIDVYFQRIDECIQYADDGHVAYTTEQTLQTAYHTVSTTGQYNDACKEWRKKPAIDKTWAQFKTFFTAEYHDQKEQSKVNNNQANFHGANAVTDISAALDNLAMAATNDRDIVQHLTSINNQLTATNKLLTEQLAASLQANQAAGRPNANRPNAPAPAPAPAPAQLGSDGRTSQARLAWEATLDPNGYCWSHGYKVKPNHNSCNCQRKLIGHKDEATRADPMGGCMRGKPRE